MEYFNCFMVIVQPCPQSEWSWLVSLCLRIGALDLKVCCMCVDTWNYYTPTLLAYTLYFLDIDELVFMLSDGNCSSVSHQLLFSSSQPSMLYFRVKWSGHQLLEPCLPPGRAGQCSREILCDVKHFSGFQQLDLHFIGVVCLTSGHPLW